MTSYTERDFIRDGVAERSAWEERQRTLHAETAEQLSALMLDDYRHLTERRAYEPGEARKTTEDNAALLLDAIKDDATARFTLLLAAARDRAMAP
jgi:hypothetical protein